jgi:hypothetical protein
MHNIINNLKILGVSMFAAISPNVNWKNSSNWVRTKQLFRPHFNQVHLSASSSDIGNDPLYINKHLVGGSALLTFGLWSSKISTSTLDESGHGIFSVTMIQGKGKRCISFISAYIAVSKGSDIGTESLFAQQVTLHEKNSIKSGLLPSKSFCPRIHAIRQLNNIIHNLQQQQHAILLMLDANQTVSECYKGNKLIPYSIEWLCLQRGMDDPFIKLLNARPNSTTVTPNRVIDHILTFGIDIINISTL